MSLSLLITINVLADIALLGGPRLRDVTREA